MTRQAGLLPPKMPRDELSLSNTASSMRGGAVECAVEYAVE